jgi:hypothetical protein
LRGLSGDLDKFFRLRAADRANKVLRQLLAGDHENTIIASVFFHIYLLCKKGGSELPPYRVWRLEVALQQAFQIAAVAGLAGYLLISEATASINAFALPKSANL